MATPEEQTAGVRRLRTALVAGAGLWSLLLAIGFVAPGGWV